MTRNIFKKDIRLHLVTFVIVCGLLLLVTQGHPTWENIYIYIYIYIILLQCKQTDSFVIASVLNQYMALIQNHC